jgi:hypothetical protein
VKPRRNIDAEASDLHARLNPSMVYTIDRPVLRALLLLTGGWIFYNGATYGLVSKHIGVGVYILSFKGRHPTTTDTPEKP